MVRFAVPTNASLSRRRLCSFLVLVFVVMVTKKSSNTTSSRIIMVLENPHQNVGKTPQNQYYTRYFTAAVCTHTETNSLVMELQSISYVVSRCQWGFLTDDDVVHSMYVFQNYAPPWPDLWWCVLQLTEYFSCKTTRSESLYGWS